MYPYSLFLLPSNRLTRFYINTPLHVTMETIIVNDIILVIDRLHGHV